MLPESTMITNDRKAGILIGVFSVVVFSIIVLLGRFHFTNLELGFDVHIFAMISAIVNSLVSVLLIAALVAVKQKKYLAHKKIMLTAMVLSIVFLVSYITHHLLSGDTHFGDTNHDGVVDDSEKLAAGSIRMIYFILLAAHIFLAAIILPFILYTSYRGLTGNYEKHKKLARITWPIWLFVSVTGPIVYLMISPYYK
jgi:putative membrane protein